MVGPPIQPFYQTVRWIPRYSGRFCSLPFPLLFFLVLGSLKGNEGPLDPSLLMFHGSEKTAHARTHAPRRLGTVPYRESNISTLGFRIRFLGIPPSFSNSIETGKRKPSNRVRKTLIVPLHHRTNRKRAEFRGVRLALSYFFRYGVVW